MKDSKTGQGNPVDLDRLSIPELEGLIRNDFLASHGRTDPEFVAAAMEVIARRKAEGSPQADVDAAWETFQTRMKQKYGQQEDAPELPPSAGQAPERPKKRRWLRPAVAAAAVVAILVCLSLVPVQGTSLLGTLVGWTDDTASLLPGENSDKNIFFNDIMYQRVVETISTYTDQPILPTWYPEGSSIIRVEENSVNNGYSIIIIFSLDGNEFSLSIGLYDDAASLPTHQYEKNEGSVEEYYSNGIPHYIMGNMEQNSAVWRTGTTECSIQGFLSVDEIRQMIDSIYT